MSASWPGSNGTIGSEQTLVEPDHTYVRDIPSRGQLSTCPGLEMPLKRGAPLPIARTRERCSEDRGRSEPEPRKIADTRPIPLIRTKRTGPLRRQSRAGPAKSEAIENAG